MVLRHARCKLGRLIATTISFFSVCVLALTITSCQGTSITLPGTQSVIVSMTSANLFSPQEITVKAGDIVKFVNTDSIPHAPIVDPLNAAGGGPDSDAAFPSGVQAGDTYSWHVPIGAVVGTKWYYHCQFHGVAGNGTSLGTGMVGLIISN